MAKKNFYSQEEACKKLDIDADKLKALVRDGKLRELRDGGKATYKVEEVDKLAAEQSVAEAEKAIGDLHEGSLSGSMSAFDMLSTGELTLEDSSAGEGSMEINLASDGTQEAKEKPAAKPKSAKKPAKPDAESKASDEAESISLDMHESTGELDAMHTGDLVLEPAGEEADSGIRLASDDEKSKSGTDQISLDDTATEAGEEDDKEGTVVSSIGVSVFDDDEVEAEADPLAQTVMSSGSDAALGIDETGSGSGLLDLTRESDDTSLGAELLDEIYPAEEGGGPGEMGEATRAGLAEDIPSKEASDAFVPAVEAETEQPAAALAPARGQAVTTVVYEPDAVSTGLTGMLFVAVLIMCLAGLASAAALQGVWPSFLEVLYSKNWILAAGAAGAAGIALLAGFMIGKRRNAG